MRSRRATLEQGATFTAAAAMHSRSRRRRDGRESGDVETNGRNAERVEIAGASHVIQDENAVAVNEAILRFLARHEAHAVS
jgi:pimeloyl-ACP methyl ester carboxylesterase